MKPLRLAAAALLPAALVLLPPAAPAGNAAGRTLPPAASQGPDMVATADGVYSLEWREGDTAGLLWYTRWDTAVSMPLCARRGCTHSDNSCPSFVDSADWMLFGANGRLLLLKGRREGIREIWAVAADGTGRTLLARCPAQQDWALVSLLWEDASGFWFSQVSRNDPAVYLAFLPADGGELTVQPAPGILIQVRDGVWYGFEWPADGQNRIVARDLHTGATGTLCTVPECWEWMLRGDTLYFCDWQDGCALYTKNLNDGEPPRLRCRLESLGNSYVSLAEAGGDRVVLDRAGAQWAVDLNTGARTLVQPAWLEPGYNGGVQNVYPEVEEGCYAPGHALVMGYARTGRQYTLTSYGTLALASSRQMVPCLLDVDAWLEGRVVLTDVVKKR